MFLLIKRIVLWRYRCRHPCLTLKAIRGFSLGVEGQVKVKFILGLNFRTAPYILHYACGPMYVVLCLSIRKQQKQRLAAQLLHFCHHFRWQWPACIIKYGAVQKFCPIWGRGCSKPTKSNVGATRSVSGLDRSSSNPVIFDGPSFC